ncbi:MAG TPA: hypothetical protein VFA87_01825, partial [Rhizomicrobium sp.]|nr:hypothetical protein [Rhizomicrobium sp.]
MTRSGLPRRNVLKLMGAAPAAMPAVSSAWAQGSEVCLLRETSGPAGAPAVQHAAAKLEAALKAHGAKLTHITDVSKAKGLTIIAAAPASSLAAGFPAPASGWAGPDALRLVPG